MNQNKDYLETMVRCPECKRQVVNGDRIWLNGECLCPKCYQRKREAIDRERRESIIQ